MSEQVEQAGSVEELDVVIVGAGVSGLYAIHRLRALGLSLRCFDKAGDVGGTWWWNRYPGARCDIESLWYSYSFDEDLQQEWSWSERYATQGEILRYLEHVADRFDLRRDVRFETTVERTTWDATASRWLVETDRGDRVAARFVIFGTGCLSVPRVPPIPGLESFAGETYHTGTWPHEPVDFRGKRVAIIGTGSSGVQSLPIIAQDAADVLVLQRTPNYSIPAFNHPMDPEEEAAAKARYAELREACRRSSGGNPWRPRARRTMDDPPEEREAQLAAHYAKGGFHFHAAYRDMDVDEEANEAFAAFVRERIRERVGDDRLAGLLTPSDHPFATKRMCIDTGYYEAYRRPNVHLVDVRATPIEEITPTGVRFGGEEHPVDVIVLATGFDAMTGALLAVDIRGRDGVTLRERWEHGPRTYLGLMAHGFPNLFMITGPGSPSVLSNVIVSIEQHVELATDAIAMLDARGLPTMEPTADAEARWVDHVRELGEATLYPRASSWYMGANIPGKPRVFLPYVGGADRYRAECERIVESGWEGFALGTPAAATAD